MRKYPLLCCSSSGRQDALQGQGSLSKWFFFFVCFVLFCFLNAVINDNFSAVPNIFTTPGLKNIRVEVGEEKKKVKMCVTKEGPLSVADVAFVPGRQGCAFVML